MRSRPAFHDIGFVTGAMPFRFALVLVAAFLIVASRRPDTLVHANLWAEDGWIWYPTAYAEGWRCLLVPVTGYLQTISRLTALATVHFPLTLAPTLFAGTAIVIQAVTATFLLTRRMLNVCPPVWVRGLFAVLYLLLPNSFEVYANLTNAQWHLALLAFLIIVGRSPSSVLGWVFDVVVLVVSGLSGPFCLLLAPVALLRTLGAERRSTVGRASVVLVCAGVQLWCLLGHASSRVAPVLGADPQRLAIILAMQIILPLMLGRHSTSWYIDLPAWKDGVLPWVVTVAATILVFRSAAQGPAIVRWSCLFAGLVIAAALMSPVIGSATPAWVALSTPDVGDRYYFFPMLAWAVVLFALAADGNAWFRWIGRSCLLITLVMLPGDWHLPTAFQSGGRTDFKERAKAFRHAPPGTVMSFPIHPIGVAPMILRKLSS